MKNHETEPVPLTETVRRFGYGLGGGAWSVGTGMSQLTRVFDEMGGRSDVIEDDMQRLEQSDPEAIVKFKSQYFNQLVAMMTRGIALLDEYDMPPSDLATDSLVSSTTEGVTWEDPASKQYRDMLTDRNAELLRMFAEGLSSNEIPMDDIKALMRREIEGMLDEVSTRTSFAAVRFVKVLSTISKKAELTNWQTRVNMAKRGARVARKIGANAYKLV